MSNRLKVEAEICIDVYEMWACELGLFHFWGLLTVMPKSDGFLG